EETAVGNDRTVIAGDAKRDRAARARRLAFPVHAASDIDIPVSVTAGSGENAAANAYRAGAAPIANGKMIGDLKNTARDIDDSSTRSGVIDLIRATAVADLDVSKRL